MAKRFLSFTVMLLLLVTPAFAQSTTAGGLQGTITDNTGAALPGVTVELSGVAQQGVRTAVTDGQGNYRFINVPPGENYRVTATLSGFAPATKTIARVSLGQEATVNFELRAGVTEAITVTAEAPLVDVSRTTTGVNVTARQFESLPTQRSFQQLTSLAPGVNMEMGESRGQLGNSPSVGASSAPENNYIIDGLSTTDARYGTSGTNLTMNFVEEVQVMTGGYSAEFGRSTGGVFNVITKSGGNEFHGDVFGYISDSSWSEKRLARSQRGTNFVADVTDSRDLGLSLGGPIMRDRLWFFGAFNPSRRETDIGEADPLFGDAATSLEQTTNFYAGKLTFAITPNHTLVGTVFGDPTELDGWLVRGLNSPPAEAGAATRKAEVGSNNYNVRYNGIITQNWLAEANFGRHQRDNTLGPATEIGRTVPRQIDETRSSFQRGGFQRNVDEESTRDAWAIKFSNFFSQHELRYGIDVEENAYIADTSETWYRYLGDVALARNRGECAPGGVAIECARIEERIYRVAGSGETANEALFLQDQWKLRPNVQLNLGVRWERQRMGSGRGVALASSPDQINTGDYEIADEFTLDNNWAPRLGIVWDPRNNGRTKVYAYAGRFFEAVPLDLNIRALNGEDYIINEYQHLPSASNPMLFNPTGNPIPAAVRNGGIGAVTEGGFTKTRARNLTAATLTPLSSDLKAQYQDEYILGGEYQFGDVWSAGVRLVDRELGRVIEDFGVFTDPENPQALTGYAIANPGEGALGGPYPAPERYYRAAEFTVQRAFRDNWQVVASYTYAQAEGNYEGLFMSGYEQLDPNITALYDLPEFLNNSGGRLRADRPVNLKIHSSYRFPFGLTVSEGFYFSSGIPYSALGPDELNGYGDGTIFLEPRGEAGRTPNFWTLDLHADYALPLFRSTGRSLSFIVDVFNVTNQNETLEVDQDFTFQGQDEHTTVPGTTSQSIYFATPVLYQTPRTVQLGVKFTY
ncbi:MAG TPA: TonB-dependent receptor [Thermoanaerobaculia bacterium]